jgi:uncharacterized membrane protein HdeD (DUF308 family)
MIPTSLTWKSALGRGAIAVVLGVIAIFWPDTAIFTFMLIWGLWALVDGVITLFLAFQPELRAARTMLLVQGALGVVFGVLIVTHPGISASVVTWLAGVWFVVRGLLEALAAFGTSPRGMLLASAAIDIVLGVLFMVNPGGSAKGITVVLGIVALVWGIALIVIGLAWRRQPTTHEPATA